MRTGFRLLARKTRAHIPQMACLVLLLMVGVCFFITLSTISLRYGETAERYYADNGYANASFYGAFGEESVALLAGQRGVHSAAGRTVRDFREGERMFRAISLTDGINIPHLYEGRLPENAAECVMLRRSATAMGLWVGGTVTLGQDTLTITGLAASPEYIYMVQNERNMMAPPASFAVLYVDKAFFGLGYNELVALTGDSFSMDEAAQAVGAFQSVLQKDQINHTLYRSDLDEVASFAAIFPLIFAVLIAAVIYVMLSRNIQKDRRQIGIMKALGMPGGKIICIYLLQYCLAALAGALLGCLLAMLVSGGIIGIFSAMFEVPALSFAIYPGMWAGAVAVAGALCAISALMALFSILPLLPAQAMRPRTPKSGKRSLPERLPALWQRLPWGARYALKNALRNKGRFWAVVLGMCGSCALLVFSLGFNNSVTNTYNQYFSGFANYDAIISFDPLPLAAPQPVLSRVDSGYKALVLPATVRGETVTLTAVEEGFDMVNIPAAALQTGVILPEYYAQQWNARAGDTLRINGYNVKVSAVVPQVLGLALYTSLDYLHSVAGELPPAYNTIYAKSSNMASLTQFLKDEQIDFSTIDDDKTSFDAIMESMSVLIWFLIACSVLLGFAVLYAVGLINLSAREYEYMFMGVMGFPLRGIMAAHIRETLFQLALAVPLGFWAGNILLHSIKGEFSGSNFVISASIFPQSYVLATLALLCVAAAMAAITSRHIQRLDIVEGLKAQDE